MEHEHIPNELNDASDLPELHQGNLDWEYVDDLARDLSQLTQIYSVVPRIRGATPGQAPPQYSLDEAFAGLRAGTLMGVQVRYSYNGEDWCDTLLPSPGGARLVRMSDSQLGGAK